MVISVMLTLLVLCLIFGVAFYVFGLIPLPSPWNQIGKLILGILFLIILIYELLPMTHLVR